MKVGTSQGRLLWTTWILTALAPAVLVIAPLAGHVNIAHPAERSGILAVLIAAGQLLALCFTFLCVFVWLTGKIICVVLVALIGLVAVMPGISLRTKVLTALPGLAASVYFYMVATSVRHL
jgi:hypothetical protein